MAFVVSAGALKAVDRPVLPAAYAMRLSQDFIADYGTLWRTQPELRTVVDFLARNIAQLGLHVFRRETDVDRTRLTDHPLALLLDRPNGATTRYRLIDHLVHDLCVYDEAYLLKVRGEDGMASLRRLRPQRVWPIGDDWMEPEGFSIVGAKGTLDVAATDMVFFRGYNPHDDRAGTPPIEALRRILAEEWAANAYREQLWRNAARIGGYLKRPLDAPDWSKDARDRFRDQWQAQWTGDSATAGGTPVLEDGMDFVPAATSPREAQYVESRKLTREEVARSFHVPLPMVGILDHATFSNIREQHKQLYQDCLGPWLEMISQEIELQLLPDMPDNANIYVEFNIREKLRGNFEDEAAQLSSSVGGPWMTRNEARARLNLPQIDGADDLIVPLNVAIDGQSPVPPAAATQASLPITPKARSVKARALQGETVKFNEQIAAFFRRQGQAVASALGAIKARQGEIAVSDIFDIERWNAELAQLLKATNERLATSAAVATLAGLGADPVAFDQSIMGDRLDIEAQGIAKSINTTTADHLAKVIGDGEPQAAVKALFGAYVAFRATRIAATQATAISGFASVEAAKHIDNDGTTKTWVASSSDAEHVALNGQTVGLDDLFSNGARWPGDAKVGAGETAECRCELLINA